MEDRLNLIRKRLKKSIERLREENGVLRKRLRAELEEPEGRS
jgi:hypothetical protein